MTSLLRFPIPQQPGGAVHSSASRERAIVVRRIGKCRLRYQRSDGPAIRGNDRPAAFGRGTPAIHLNFSGRLKAARRFISCALIKPRKQTARCFTKCLCLPFIAVFHAWNLAKDWTHEEHENSARGAPSYE